MKKIVLLLVLLSMLLSPAASLSVYASDVPDGMWEKSGSVNFPEEGVPVLMYHSISTKYDNSICVSAEEFEQQLQWLYDNGYSTVNVEDFSKALAGTEVLPEKPILITFDDGYRDNFEVAWPIMERFGFRATFFIVTNSVNSYNMDWDTLKQLQENGNSIGSHTLDHCNLSQLDSALQENQLRQSKEDLENMLGIDVSAFCFPYGKYNQTTFSLLPRLGYDLSFSIKEGRVHYGDDVYCLNRIHVRGGMPLSQFVEKVSYK